jgi:hypothetical protein
MYNVSNTKEILYKKKLSETGLEEFSGDDVDPDSTSVTLMTSDVTHC